MDAKNYTAETDAPRIWSLEETPDFFHGRYARFAIISHAMHLETLDEKDSDTLIVSCDWLLWQKLVNQGRHCVYFEAGLLGWDGDGLCTDLSITANDWLFAGAKDMTLFDGVSLGAQFMREIDTFIYCYKRLERALSGLTRRYRPNEFVFLDFQTEVHFLDMETRYRLVESVARAFEVGIVDRRRAPDADDPDLPVEPGSYKPDATLLVAPRAHLAGAYEYVFETISRVRRALGGCTGSVLLASTHLNTVPILRSLRGNKASPAVLARHFPRKRDLRFAWRCLRNSVVWASARHAELSPGDKAEVERISRTLKKRWADSPARGLHRAIRDYVAAHILAPGRLETFAREIKCCRDILDRHKPSHVFIDTFAGRTAGILATIARQRGMTVDFMWHGQYLHNLKNHLFGCDARFPAVISRALTWGRIDEAWLDNIGAKVGKLRVGSPNTRGRATAQDARRTGRRRALLLQYTPGIDSITGLNDRQFSNLVRTARHLNGIGFSEIRFRKHPGGWKKAYFDKIIRYFRLPCEIDGGGPLQPHLAWADIVVGPAQSGAMPEALAAGKPFFALGLKPHCFDAGFVRSLGAFETQEALDSSLGGNTIADQTEVAEILFSKTSIADPAARTWRALEDQALANVGAPA